MSVSAVCNKCGVELIVAKSKNGRSVPLDARPSDSGRCVINDEGLVVYLIAERMLTPDWPKERHTLHRQTCSASPQEWRLP